MRLTWVCAPDAGLNLVEELLPLGVERAAPDVLSANYLEAK